MNTALVEVSKGLGRVGCAALKGAGTLVVAPLALVVGLGLAGASEAWWFAKDVCRDGLVNHLRNVGRSWAVARKFDRDDDVVI